MGLRLWRGWLILLGALPGCLLQVVSGDVSNEHDAGPCPGVYCAGFYDCDPVDKICKCGGALCDTGNCDDSTRTCLPGCGAVSACGAPTTDSTLAFGGEGCATASTATRLPDAVVGQLYSTRITAVCGELPYTFGNAQPDPPYLSLTVNGDLSGTPLTPGGPYAVLIGVRDAAGHQAYQNFVVNEVAAP
jgi:hypothetical protein